MRLKLLLFARCLLLVTFCSLLITFSSLVDTFFSLLVTFCSLFFTFCWFLVMKVQCKLRKNTIKIVLASMLVASAKILERKGSISPSSFYQQHPQRLVIRVSLICLVDEFFIFLLPVLRKEIRPSGESKISSFCFCIWCKKNQEAGRVQDFLV